MIDFSKITSPSLTDEEKEVLREKIKKFNKIRKEDFNEIYNVFEIYFEEKKYESLKWKDGFGDFIKTLINCDNDQKISKDLDLKSDGKFAICFKHVVQSLLEGDSLEADSLEEKKRQIKVKEQIYEALDSANNEDNEISCIFVKFLDDKWLKCKLFELSDFLIEE